MVTADSRFVVDGGGPLLSPDAAHLAISDDDGGVYDAATGGRCRRWTCEGFYEPYEWWDATTLAVVTETGPGSERARLASSATWSPARAAPRSTTSDRSTSSTTSASAVGERLSRPRRGERAAGRGTHDGPVPELPEVETARAAIERAALRRTIADVDDRDTYVCRPHSAGEIRDALVGRQLTSAPTGAARPCG